MTQTLNPKGEKYKTDKFTLHQERPGRWKVSGRDSGGNYRRIRFDANDLSEAMRQSERILQNPDRQIPTLLDNHPMIFISDALLRSSETRTWSEYTRREDLRNCEFFLKWIDNEGLQYWHELRFEHIQQYHKHLMDRGLAFNTVRLYLLPVRRASAWIVANWPKHYVNICQNLRLSKRDTSTVEYDENEGNPCLSIHCVLDFTDWLSRDPFRDRLTTGVALQGLMGLQMQEALRLTWDKVNLPEGTITIDGAVKNRYRIRKIPMVSVVSSLLRRLWNSTDHSGSIIPDYAAYDNYSHAVIRELRRWDPNVTIKPKDLRNTIQTEAIDDGWYGYYVQRYVGHAPTTIGERHYHGDKGKRMVPLFREKVVKHIEAKISTWKAPADSVIMSGPRLVVNE